MLYLFRRRYEIASIIACCSISPYSLHLLLNILLYQGCSDLSDDTQSEGRNGHIQDTYQVCFVCHPYLEKQIAYVLGAHLGYE